MVSITVPNVQENIATPRGTKQSWGAVVKTVSGFNRHVLHQAPMTAVQMLTYKAAEAGIPCEVMEDTQTELTIGRDLVAARKAERGTKRKIKQGV